MERHALYWTRTSRESEDVLGILKTHERGQRLQQRIRQSRKHQRHDNRSTAYRFRFAVGWNDIYLVEERNVSVHLSNRDPCSPLRDVCATSPFVAAVRDTFDGTVLQRPKAHSSKLVTAHKLNSIVRPRRALQNYDGLRYLYWTGASRER